jgi:hypothetical protein
MATAAQLSSRRQIPLNGQHLAQRRHCLGQLWIELQRARRRRLGPRIRIIRRHPIVGQAAPAVRDACIRAAVSRILQQHVLVELQALPESRLGVAREVEAALEVVVVRLEVGRRRRQRVLVPHQPQLERVRDGARDLVLDGEDVLQLAVEGLRPELVAVGDVDQLDVDPDPVADLPDAALEHRADTELVADLANVDLLALKGEAGGAGRHLHVGQLGEGVDDVLGVIPSLKYSFSGSALMLVSGMTATDFCDGPTRPSAGLPVGVVPVPPRSRFSMASASAPADAGRSTGVRDSVRVTRVSTGSGTSRVARTFGIGDMNRFAMIDCAVGPVNGGSPVSIS